MSNWLFMIMDALLELIQETWRELGFHAHFQGFFQHQRGLNLFLVDIVLENSCSLFSVSEFHESDPVLNSFDPPPLVDAPVYPNHLPVAIAAIFNVLAFVYISTLPLKYTFSVLPIESILALIEITLMTILFRFLFPLALPMLVAIFENARI
jgi:hypothetical protein